MPDIIPHDWSPDIPVIQLAQISLILGFIVPWVAALLNACDWHSNLKRFTVFVISFATAAVMLSVAGQLDTGNLVTTGLATLATAVWVYKNYWKEAVRNFEIATTPGVKGDGPG